MRRSLLLVVALSSFTTTALAQDVGDLCGHWFDWQSPCYAEYECAPQVQGWFFSLGICVPHDYEACRDDLDCEDGYCGCVDGACSVLSCKSFQEAGDECAGFVRPQDERVCAPDLVCAEHPLGVGSGEGVPVCALPAEPADIVAHPSEYDGQVVTMVAEVTSTPPYCTLMACMPTNACCNSCGAALQLSDVGEAIRLYRDERPFGCGGSNCGIEAACAAQSGERMITGRIEVVDGLQIRLHIQHYWFTTFE